MADSGALEQTREGGADCGEGRPRVEAGEPKIWGFSQMGGPRTCCAQGGSLVCTWRYSNVCLKTDLFAPVYQWVNRRESPWGALPCIPGPLCFAQHQRCLPPTSQGPELNSRAGQQGGRK